MDNLPQKNPPVPQPTHNLPTRRSLPNAVAPQRRPADGAEAEEGISPRKILAAIRYCWKWALPAGIVLATAASLTVYALFEPQYEAAAWIRIEENAPYLAFQTGADNQQSKGFVKTQIELLRSPMVLVPVTAEPEVSALPEVSEEGNVSDWLKRKIMITSVGESELYTVSFTCSKPKAATLVVNAVLDSYFRLRSSEHSQRVARVIQILELERDARTQEVERLRKGLRELAKEISGKDPFAVSQSPATETNSLASLANRLVSIEVEESILRAKVQSLENLDNSQPTPVPDGLVEQAVAANPQVRTNVEALAQKNAQLKQYLAVSNEGKEGSAYQRVAKVVAQEEQALEDLKATLRAQAKIALEVERTGRLGQELVSMRSELESHALTRDILRKRYEDELRSMKQYNGDTVNFVFKQEELARAEKVLDLISDRLVQLRTEQGAPARVWEMKRASVPVAPIVRWPYMNMLLAFAVGLCAPFGLAILKEQIAARISDADVVGQQAHLAILGEIACLPTRKPGATSLGQREQRAVHLFEESVDALRTNLLLGPHANGLRSLAVTSAVNQEGKTSVAVQLAASIARACRVRVLIIDGDLRDPGVHNVLEVPREPGLTNVLAGDCSLRDAITVSRVEGIDVLPAGVLRGNPHPLLANGRWEALLKQLPQQYQYIIIDTPPVLAASEALVLARNADAVLICALRDVTRLPQLKKATQRIAATGAKMAGLVLNGIPTSHYGGRYGAYSYVSNWMKNE